MLHKQGQWRVAVNTPQHSVSRWNTNQQDTCERYAAIELLHCRNCDFVKYDKWFPRCSQHLNRSIFLHTIFMFVITASGIRKNCIFFNWTWHFESANQTRHKIVRYAGFVTEYSADFEKSQFSQWIIVLATFWTRSEICPQTLPQQDQLHNNATVHDVYRFHQLISWKYCWKVLRARSL